MLFTHFLIDRCIAACFSSDESKIILDFLTTVSAAELESSASGSFSFLDKKQS